ncbi:MAG TPA: hypothetical protein VFC19_29575 [Candidatus Limnocylindrales bacterium]|nr:hypothetical protein [Candidatus Limnocylindrales bacterium]
MFTHAAQRLAARIGSRLAAVRRHPERGAQTVDIMMWVGVFLAVILIVGATFRDDVRDFFNALRYDIGF